MDKLIIASMRSGAGKTSMIVGMAKVLKKRIGYMKPFGDKMLYRKKRLWDYDAALMTNIFDLKDAPEDMSIGFDHSKLRYMYDEAGTRRRLTEAASHVGEGKDVLFVEGGKDITYGISVHLDSISLARHMGGKLFIVLSGDADTVLDDVSFLKKHVDTADVGFGGVIINKVHDAEDFKRTYLDGIAQMGIDVVGLIPYKTELTHFSIDYLSESLFAKVIAGEGALGRVVENVLVGAMSADAVLRHPVFQKKNKLVITSGDRSDMILAALESDAVGIILTNNILPPPNIIAMASERNVPLLLVSTDTYQTAKQIETTEPLLTKGSAEKIALLEQLVREHVNIETLL
jgi:BioD-like phosphotransacetylase family protein